MPSEEENQEEVARKKDKRCKDYFFLEPTGRILSTYDTFMLSVITYSCFTSAYYCTFEFPTNESLVMIENLILIFFSIEIILKCMRVPHDMELDNRSHLKIIKNYMKSGWLFLDLLATFPFYLFQSSDDSGSN